MLAFVSSSCGRYVSQHEGSDLCAGYVALYSEWNIFFGEEVPLAEACTGRGTRMAGECGAVWGSAVNIDSAVLNLACIWVGRGVTRVWCRSVIEMQRSNLLQGGQLCCFVLSHLHPYTWSADNSAAALAFNQPVQKIRPWSFDGRTLSFLNTSRVQQRSSSPAKRRGWTPLNEFTFKPQAFSESLWTRLKCRGPDALITSHATRYGFSFQWPCGKRGETAALPLTNLTSIRHRPIHNWQLLANWMLNKSVSYSAKIQ